MVGHDSGGGQGASLSAKKTTFTTGAVTLTHLTEEEVKLLEVMEELYLSSYPEWLPLLLAPLPATREAYLSHPVVSDALTLWRQEGGRVPQHVLPLIARGIQEPTLTNRLHVLLLQREKEAGRPPTLSHTTPRLPFREKEHEFQKTQREFFSTTPSATSLEEKLRRIEQAWSAGSLLEELLALRACQQASTVEEGLQVGTAFPSVGIPEERDIPLLSFWQHLLEEAPEKLFLMTLPPSWWRPLLQEEITRVEAHHEMRAFLDEWLSPYSTSSTSPVITKKKRLPWSRLVPPMVRRLGP